MLTLGCPLHSPVVRRRQSSCYEGQGKRGEELFHADKDRQLFSTCVLDRDVIKETGDIESIFSR